MTLFTVRLKFAAVLFLFSTLVASAQWRTPGMQSNASDPADHTLFAPPSMPGGTTVWEPGQTRIFVSAFLGLNQNTNMGAFKTDCDCQFDGKFSLANIGAQFGVDVTYQFAPTMAIIGKAYYDNKHTSETFDRRVATPIKTQQIVIIRDVNYEEVGRVSLSYFTFGLFARWQPRLERWYVFAGPGFGISSTRQIDHNVSILDAELSFPEAESVSETQRQVSVADFPADYRLEGIVGFGYDYIIRPRWYVNPEVRFGFPFTKVATEVNDRGKTIPLDDPSGWKVMSFQVSIGLKYEAF
jgi:hypothetical protein